MYQTTHAVNGERKMPDPEVSTKAKRRTFTVAYKRRILAEADQAELIIAAQKKLARLLEALDETEDGPP